MAMTRKEIVASSANKPILIGERLWRVGDIPPAQHSYVAVKEKVFKNIWSGAQTHFVTSRTNSLGPEQVVTLCETQQKDSYMHTGRIILCKISHTFEHSLGPEYRKIAIHSICRPTGYDLIGNYGEGQREKDTDPMTWSEIRRALGKEKLIVKSPALAECADSAWGTVADAITGEDNWMRIYVAGGREFSRIWNGSTSYVHCPVLSFRDMFSNTEQLIAILEQRPDEHARYTGRVLLARPARLVNTTVPDCGGGGFCAFFDIAIPYDLRTNS